MLSWLQRSLRFLLVLDTPVDRRTYCATGFGLAVVKYLGDATIIGLFARTLWKPTGYVLTTHSLLNTAIPNAPPWLMAVLALWTVPFLWIGVTFTMRRALDAGRSPWWALGFFAPYLNYLLMAGFCLVPGSSRNAGRADGTFPTGRWLPSAVVAIAAGVGLGIGMVVLAVLGKGQYGVTLFLGTPFAMGALTSFLFNVRYNGTTGETVQVTLCMLAFVAGSLFLFAFEGAFCIAMLIPMALVVGFLGAAFGRAIAQCGRRAVPPAISAMLLLPLSLALEPPKTTGQIIHEVRSSVVIDAAPERVWEHVVAFQPIPEPSDLVFRAGIAYPRYARIEGSGVGAVRYCVFSTGPFVEPVTAWEPGRRLAFDVASSPDPLHELSMYSNVSPPHLHGYLRSRRGEFLLIALPSGQTRLEGRTWYEIEMGPEIYWQVWSDFLIHRIHDRVLEHIKFEAEDKSQLREGS